MKKNKIILILLPAFVSTLLFWGFFAAQKTAPDNLYKIISLENWAASANSDRLSLSPHDNDFIHLATDEQLEKIIAKFWGNIPEFVVLTLDTTLLPGRLILEANNPHGNLYYHLYDGFIPLKSIIKVEIKSPVLQHQDHAQKK